MLFVHPGWSHDLTLCYHLLLLLLILPQNINSVAPLGSNYGQQDVANGQENNGEILVNQHQGEDEQQQQQQQQQQQLQQQHQGLRDDHLPDNEQNQEANNHLFDIDKKPVNILPGFRKDAFQPNQPEALGVIKHLDKIGDDFDSNKLKRHKNKLKNQNGNLADNIAREGEGYDENRGKPIPQKVKTPVLVPLGNEEDTQVKKSVPKLEYRFNKGSDLLQPASDQGLDRADNNAGYNKKEDTGVQRKDVNYQKSQERKSIPRHESAQRHDSVQILVKSEKVNNPHRPLLTTIDGHPYYPPTKEGVTKVNVSHLLQQIEVANSQLRPLTEKPIVRDTNYEWKKRTASPNSAHGFHNAEELPDKLVPGSDRQSQEVGNNNAQDNNNIDSWKPVDTVDEPFKRQEQLTPGVDKKYDDFNRAFNPDNGRLRDSNFQRSFNKPKIPTAPPRPESKARTVVDWFEEYRQYALRASVDLRLRIRHAPIPLDGSPWPLPQVYRPSRSQMMLRPGAFQFHAPVESCDILEMAFHRTRRNMFGNAGEEGMSYMKFFAGTNNDDFPSLIELHQINVTVATPCDENSLPHLDMNEAYDLTVKRSGASIVAKEVWGALRGLETFSQIVYQDLKGRFVVNKTIVNDFPRFPHRGILLDTARHYLSKDTIITNLEAMAQNKMNVFHWHIVDEQSFPFQSKVLPNLTRYGAYDAKTHIYTHADIGEIIEEARYRGIRVIPEFDTPGHTFAWGLGQDHLLTPCYDYSKLPNGYYGPINPILKSTYRFLQTLFTEVFSVFKDKYMHLGGDEVPFDCWETNPFIKRFIERNNLTDVRDVLSLYERKLLDIVKEIGNKRAQGAGYIVWQEVFDNGVKLKPDAIVQIWMGDAWDIDRVTRKGYRALFSSCWYLDYINYGQDWDKYYTCDQIGPNLDDYNVKNQSLLIGGEACLWTEFADDDIIMPRLWPRASAAAERLWSHKNIRDHVAAAPRIEEQRCRMKRRGLQVGVLGGPGICRKYRKPKSGGWVKSQNEDERDQSLQLGFNGGAKQVYMVDMNAMYVVPLVLVVIIACVAVLSTLQGDHQRYRLVAILTYPVTGVTSKRGFRGLLYGFMLFVVVWCIWSSPMWLNTWENGNKGVHRVPAGGRN